MNELKPDQFNTPLNHPERLKVGDVICWKRDNMFEIDKIVKIQADGDFVLETLTEDPWSYRPDDKRQRFIFRVKADSNWYIKTIDAAAIYREILSEA